MYSSIAKCGKQESTQGAIDVEIYTKKVFDGQQKISGTYVTDIEKAIIAEKLLKLEGPEWQAISEPFSTRSIIRFKLRVNVNVQERYENCDTLQIPRKNGSEKLGILFCKV